MALAEAAGKGTLPQLKELYLKTTAPSPSKPGRPRGRPPDCKVEF